MTPPPVSETAAWTDDDAQRLASLKRCLPHMVGDVGGIWPRDVEWLIATVERLRAATRESETPTWPRNHAGGALDCDVVSRQVAPRTPGMWAVVSCEAHHLPLTSKRQWLTQSGRS